MARSMNGLLIGNAARLERLDLLAERIEQRSQFSIHFEDAFLRLKEIDPGWEAWFDGRPEQTCGQMLPLIENRIKELSMLSV
jgi:hypothetical protein